MKWLILGIGLFLIFGFAPLHAWWRHRQRLAEEKIAAVDIVEDHAVKELANGPDRVWPGTTVKLGKMPQVHRRST